MGKIYQVKVFGIEGEMKVIELCSTEEAMKKMTVLQLRTKVTQVFPGNADELQMLFANQRLEGDYNLLSSYGIVHLSVIQLVLRLSGGLAA